MAHTSSSNDSNILDDDSITIKEMSDVNEYFQNTEPILHKDLKQDVGRILESDSVKCDLPLRDLSYENKETDHDIDNKDNNSLEDKSRYNMFRCKLFGDQMKDQSNSNPSLENLTSNKTMVCTKESFKDTHAAESKENMYLFNKASSVVEKNKNLSATDINDIIDKTYIKLEDEPEDLLETLTDDTSLITLSKIDEHFKEEKQSLTLETNLDYIKLYKGKRKRTRKRSINMKHMCLFCNRRYPQQKLVEIHLRSHTGERPFTCDTCGKAYVSEHTLKTHKITHSNKKPFVCDICGNGYAQKGNLQNHRRTHTGEKPFVCAVCGHGFAQISSLQQHHRVHTGERPYICDVCGVALTSSKSLKRHKRTHTGERPYKCDVCEKAFTCSNHLTNHKVMHTGARPHICEYCGAAFGRSDYLSIHMRRHTGERPYTCDKCGKKFTQGGPLRTHKKLHERKALQAALLLKESELELIKEEQMERESEAYFYHNKEHSFGREPDTYIYPNELQLDSGPAMYLCNELTGTGRQSEVSLYQNQKSIDEEAAIYNSVVGCSQREFETSLYHREINKDRQFFVT